MKNLKSNFVAPCFLVIAVSLALIGLSTSQAGSAQLRRAAAGTVYEGEALVTSGKILVSGGQVASQPMAAFGQGWSGNAQLLWTGGQPGAVLDLTLDVAAEGIYEVELHMTRAPDFGRLRIQVENKNAPERFDGYASTVVPSGPFSLGTFDLQAGPRKLSFMIDGKNERSTNLFAGIDFIALKKVPVAASKTLSSDEPVNNWKITAFSINPAPTMPGWNGGLAYKLGQLITVKCSYEPIVPNQGSIRIYIADFQAGQGTLGIQKYALVNKAGELTVSYPVAGSGIRVVSCAVAEGDDNAVIMNTGDTKDIEIQVVAGILPKEGSWPSNAPIIQTPITSGKIVILPRNPGSSHCADGSTFWFEWQYAEETWGAHWQPLKMMLKPLACVPEGSTKDTSGMKPGLYQVRVQEKNGKYNFTSDWSNWVLFKIPTK